MAVAAGWTRIERRELVALVLLLICGAYLLGRHLAAPSLEFDEGVYVGSADLLGHGLKLGSDVFSSQPPLFFALLDATERLGGGSLTVFHGMTVAIALGGTLAGWAIVRSIAGPFPALVAAAMVVLAPGVVDAAAVVSADVPSVALGTGALLAARASRERAVWGAAAGVLICCALLVKLLAVPFAVALAVVAIVDRPPRRALIWFAAGSAAVLGAVGIAYAGVLGDLWREAVGLHLRAHGSAVVLPHPSIAGQVALIVTGYVGILAVLTVGLRHVPRNQLASWARLRLDLLVTLAAGLLLIAVNRPLLHHHLVILAWPLALIAASTLPTRVPERAVAVAALGCLLLLPWAIRGRDTVQGAESARIDAAAAVVRSSTAPGQTVVSDLPLVPLTAGRETASATADPSAVRIGTGSLTREQILEAAGGAGATVVGRSFRLVPGLAPELKLRYARVADVDGIRVYTEPRRR
jgi:hypothetical protein